jgi:hypothetical protein
MLWFATIAIVAVPILLILATTEPLEPMPHGRNASVEIIEQDPTPANQNVDLQPTTERDRDDRPRRTRTPRRERDGNNASLASPPAS